MQSGLLYELVKLTDHLDFFCICGSDPELIFLTDGASKGVMQILQSIIRGSHDGVWFLNFSTFSSLLNLLAVLSKN